MRNKYNSFIKRSISMFLCCLIIFNGIALSAFAAEMPAEKEKKQYKVYNGYGELVYTADSLEEAENYLKNLQCSQGRSSSSGAQIVFKTALSGTVNALLLIGYTAYAINKYQMGEIEAKEIITTIISPPSLEEIIEFNTRIGVYSVGTSVINPYPPHSYQATTWIRNNFYYVTM